MKQRGCQGVKVSAQHKDCEDGSDMCRSLWNVSKGFHRLGHGSVGLDVLPCCVLDLALLQSKKLLKSDGDGYCAEWPILQASN